MELYHRNFKNINSYNKFVNTERELKGETIIPVTVIPFNDELNIYYYIEYPCL